MITDTDIKKLKGVFATKADLKKFATKADLKKFATKVEFKKLDERLCKQEEDLEELKERTQRIELNAISRTEFVGLTEQIETLGKNFDKRMDELSGNIDALAKGMDVEKSEYTAIGLQLDRHKSDKSVHLQVQS